MTVEMGSTEIAELIAKTRQSIAKEIINRIETYFIDTVGTDGVVMHHIDNEEWINFKSRYLQEEK